MGFFSKDDTTYFNADIGNNEAYKSFNYKAKFLEETVAQSASDNYNGILKNANIAVPLKYLSNFLKITWNAID